MAKLRRANGDIIGMRRGTLLDSERRPALQPFAGSRCLRSGRTVRNGIAIEPCDVERVHELRHLVR